MGCWKELEGMGLYWGKGESLQITDPMLTSSQLRASGPSRETY